MEPPSESPSPSLSPSPSGGNLGGGGAAERPPLPPVEASQLRPVTTLGRGSYGKVVLAEVAGTGELVAVKVVAKARLKSKAHADKAVTELKAMRDVAGSSPFLVGTRGAFQSSSALFYILPYCAGGELFFHLQQQGRFRESKTRILVMQVLLALEHLHNHGIVYRDLKPENVLISVEGRAQVADFGLCKFLPKVDVEASAVAAAEAPKRRSFSLFRRTTTKRESVAGNGAGSTISWWGTTKTRCGTPAYNPPELVRGEEHGLEADFWTLGVLMYELLVGDPPFIANEVKEVYDLILANKPEFPSKRISDVAKDLLVKLMCSDRKARLGYGPGDASLVKAHPFFDPPKKGSKADPALLTWQAVSSLTCPPALVPEDIGLGDPKDAIFFHTEFVREDVREYIPPISKIPTAQQVYFSSVLKDFATVPDSQVESFVSDQPLPSIEKGDVDPNDLAAKFGPPKQGSKVSAATAAAAAKKDGD